MKKIAVFLIVVLSFCLVFASEKEDLTAYYGDISPENYLSGKFDPAVHPLFINLSKLSIPTDGRTHYLRISTARALKRMIDAFQKDHPGVRLYVTSSTRNFDYQKRIWDAKFYGHRLVDGKNIKKTIPDEKERVRKILEVSSMPGTSRHHWGTDFDINTLVNSYYAKGDGKIIYQWLSENAARYGFYQAYTAGRSGGYNEEKWHWSYVRESRFFLQEWLHYFENGTSSFSKDAFGGSQYADTFAKEFVTVINGDCK
jgi:LAS superfamily LD-carboxypeptidase LdcB